MASTELKESATKPKEEASGNYHETSTYTYNANGMKQISSSLLQTNEDVVKSALVPLQRQPLQHPLTLQPAPPVSMLLRMLAQMYQLVRLRLPSRQPLLLVLYQQFKLHLLLMLPTGLRLSHLVGWWILDPEILELGTIPPDTGPAAKMPGWLSQLPSLTESEMEICTRVARTISRQAVI